MNSQLLWVTLYYQQKTTSIMYSVVWFNCRRSMILTPSSPGFSRREETLRKNMLKVYVNLSPTIHPRRRKNQLLKKKLPKTKHSGEKKKFMYRIEYTISLFTLKCTYISGRNVYKLSPCYQN